MKTAFRFSFRKPRRCAVSSKTARPPFGSKSLALVFNPRFFLRTNAATMCIPPLISRYPCSQGASPVLRPPTRQTRRSSSRSYMPSYRPLGCINEIGLSYGPFLPYKGATGAAPRPGTDCATSRSLLGDYVSPDCCRPVPVLTGECRHKTTAAGTTVRPLRSSCAWNVCFGQRLRRKRDGAPLLARESSRSSVAA